MVSESSAMTSDLDAYIREQMARWTVPGAVVGVLRDGGRETRAYGVTSLETGYPVRPDTLFPIGSIGKVYTAALVMTLADDGTLNLDAPVVTYLPDLRLADARARDSITLRQLLSHQSGLFGDYYDEFGMGDDALARCVASYHTLRQLSAPGELWAYCSSGFMLAGRIAEVVTGQHFETAMRERIFAPLGLTHSLFFAQEAIVYPTAVGHSLKTPGGDEHQVCREYLLPRNVAPAGGIISDAGDLLTFAAFFMGDGTWNGRRVLSPAALEAMLTPQVRAPSYAAAGFAEWGGLGWAIRFIDGVKVVEHGGSLSGFEVKLKLVPARRFAIAVLTNSGRGVVMGNRVAEWALDHFLDLRAPRPQLISLSDDALARCAGRYRAEGEEVTLTVEDDGLRRVISYTGPTSNHEQSFPPNLLRPLSQREFVVVTQDENEGAQVDFIEGDGGAIRFLRMDGRLYDACRITT
ncbi:MAG TPA: serine hydrolase domain-containing protein [Ktedonobacterales bacterium]|nr:serine hydrolase domain-containing protein [Ktedonobacterales bacterium]